MSRSKEPRQHKTGELLQVGGPRARRRNRVATAIVVLLAATLVANLVVGGLVLRNLFRSDSSPQPKKAAIVDQLGLTQPNPTFAETVTNLLEQAGYAVDYYPGEQVTVDLYRDLPTHDYDLLILRVHSAIATQLSTAGEETRTEYLGLFTGEPYDATKYSDDQMKGLGKAGYYEGAPPLFGIASEFVRQSMRGRFRGTIVLIMGCDGLTMDATAKAFVEKGARAVVGWNGRVSASHTDTAIEHLLRHLVTDRLTTSDAVAQTMAEVGRDPHYDSRLLVYPPEA